MSRDVYDAVQEKYGLSRRPRQFEVLKLYKVSDLLISLDPDNNELIVKNVAELIFSDYLAQTPRKLTNSVDEILSHLKLIRDQIVAQEKANGVAYSQSDSLEMLLHRVSKNALNSSSVYLLMKEKFALINEPTEIQVRRFHGIVKVLISDVGLDWDKSATLAAKVIFTDYKIEDQTPHVDTFTLIRLIRDQVDLGY